MSMIEEIHTKCKLGDIWFEKAMEILDNEKDIRKFYCELLGICYLWTWKGISGVFESLAKKRANAMIIAGLQNKEIKVNEKMRNIWEAIIRQPSGC